MLGVVGRENGQIRLRVAKSSGSTDLLKFIEQTTPIRTTLNTDEWVGYNGVPATGRLHVTVCHQPGQREWARDDDGDGVREVHNNTMEGIWTGLRNFLRTFRGVNKVYLAQYVAIFEWAHNLKTAADNYLRALLGRPATTNLAS